MGNNKEIRVVLGSIRYKSASDVDFGIKVPFIQTTKQIVEYDRNVDLNLQQLFDDERQKSTIFRPSCKFLFVFKNSYTGTSTYQPFRNNLFYVNAEIDAQISALRKLEGNLAKIVNLLFDLKFSFLHLILILLLILILKSFNFIA